MKKYQIIYVDPPWKVSYLKGGKKPGMIAGGFKVPYPTMSDKEIISLPIKDLADKKCILFLWVIESRILRIKEIMKNWGFKYSGIAFVWNKRTKNDPLKVRTTLGFFTRRSCEFCFMGIKGNSKGMVLNHYVLQFVNAILPDRLHSRKPEEIKKRIVELLGDRPRIELFARQKTEGWDIWGNEVKSDIDFGIG